ncbi:MAG: nitroreductase family protein [Thermotogaceae bacterium]|nr:nitroreductase family protein [Thermotogaceae bacterium]
MEVGKAIFERRSVRFFNERQIDTSILREILIAGIYAPSAGNLQPWEFYCYCQPDSVDHIRSVSPGIMGKPKAIIVACVNEKKIKEQKLEKWASNAIIDVSMACQNMMLKAFELGVGSCPVTSFENDTLAKALALPSYVKPLILIALGYYDKLPQTPSRDESVIHIETRSCDKPSQEQAKIPEDAINFATEILGFLVTSAKINTREPPSYAIMRLLEAASKICEYLASSHPERRDISESIKNELDTASSLYFIGDDNYISHLERALEQYLHLLSS